MKILLTAVLVAMSFLGVATGSKTEAAEASAPIPAVQSMAHVFGPYSTYSYARHVADRAEDAGYSWTIYRVDGLYYVSVY